MESTEALLSDLEAAVKEFPLRHMEQHILPEFRVRLERLARELQRFKLPIRASTLAPLLKERARYLRLNEEQLRSLIRTVKLKSAVLSETRDWFAYALCGPREPEPLSDVVALAPRRVRHALRHARKHRRTDIEVHSCNSDQWIYMSVYSRGAESRTPLLIAFQPVASFMFVSRRRLQPQTADAIATGLGWASAVNANLTGRDLDALPRILEQDKNGSVHGLVSSAPYVPRPVLAADGIHTDDVEYNLQYAKSVTGSAPPLRMLEARVCRPLCDAPDSRPLSIGLTLRADDIAECLHELVRVSAIHPDSEWLHLYRSTTSNLIDLDSYND